MIHRLCAFLGDSIALGLAMTSPTCDRNAVVGRPASVIARQSMPGTYSWCVISAGSNNPRDPRLASRLRRIRGRLQADRCVWILPRNARARRLVCAAAASFAEPTAAFRPAHDGVHPRSYPKLMRRVRVRLGAGARPGCP
jgi:hypothetical protein